jgi:hypothetical protein
MNEVEERSEDVRETCEVKHGWKEGSRGWRGIGGVSKAEEK